MLQDPNSGAVVLAGTPVHMTVSTGTDIHGKACVFK